MMVFCIRQHLKSLDPYMLVRHSSRVGKNSIKVLLHSTLLLLLYLKEIQTHMHPNFNQSNKLVSLPWVHNSIVYTQSLHYPNVKDKLTRRSISYSNVIDQNNIDTAKYMKRGQFINQKSLVNHDVNRSNVSYDSNDRRQFPKLMTQDSTHGAYPFYVETFMDGNELDNMKDVFNYYEKNRDKNNFQNNVENKNILTPPNYANSASYNFY